LFILPQFDDAARPDGARRCGALAVAMGQAAGRRGDRGRRGREPRDVAVSILRDRLRGAGAILELEAAGTPPR
jgi:hypothetical protein